MNSPKIVTVLRIRKAARRRSIRDISRHYFETEYVRFQIIEFVLFAIVAAVTIWPILDAVEVVRTYPF